MNATKELFDQLEYIKTRAESITDSINDFSIHELDDKESINQLLNEIDGDQQALQIHLESIRDLIN